ncbi:glycoside hydrolase family 10 protein [Clostridium minihomine]|uniref:glycoside hydrolase family 10 protein n=1 Tax=Clostridium minihomine TaxID=2045012 RepID=UPI000C76C84A|nr:family 10 glycosylhydrolase [Clostridium minihomine]
MNRMDVLKKGLAVFMAAVLSVGAGGAVYAQNTSQPVGTLAMDTRSYQMAPGNIYDFRATVSGSGLDQSKIKVYSSRDGIAKVSRVAGTDKYRITGLQEGVSYVIAEINGVHASVKVTVQKGVSPKGEACRSVSIVGANAQVTEAEMRAVWIPYMSLDMSSSADQSAAAFQKKFDGLVAQAKRNGMNTLIVHVRPFGDSLYPSGYFPWSHLLTGTQGKAPGYDPLAYMVQATHNAGMKFHAWVNPMRISLKGVPTALSADNPYTKWSGDSQKNNWTMEWEGAKYYNPGVAQVRSHIVSGIEEIVKNYSVDGVQFDDYFYPTQAASIDSVSYQASGTTLSVADWRKQNINSLVSQVYSSIKKIKPGVVFGISPQASIQNDLNMGADVYTWGSQPGYVDYICPQMYVNSQHTGMPFDSTAVTWRQLVKNPNVKLYFGLALYKAGSAVDGGTWQNSNSILADQIQKGRSLGTDGFMLYSSAYLEHDQTRAEMNSIRQLLGV